MASVGENQIPWIFPYLFASPIRRLRLSITNKKTRGNKWNPCIKFLEALKKIKGDPLIITQKLAEETSAIIQFTVSTDRPSCNKKRGKNF